MIRNERQLRIAQRKRDDARKAAVAAHDSVDRDTYEQFAREIDVEIDEYLHIRDGHQRSFDVDSIDALADALVKARIAAGLTQRDLAERLGVSEQMVQRDEARGYETAKLSRLADVGDALGYHLHGVLAPRTSLETAAGRPPSSSAST